MKKAFTLVEILIVVAILGILAAIALPQFQSHSRQAKESAAKDNLRILRNAIELYSAQHNDTAPGYFVDGSISSSVYFFAQLTKYTSAGGRISETKSASHCYGPYLREFPKNPFTNDNYILILPDTSPFPEIADGSSSWLYKPASKTIRFNSAGVDTEGTPYFDY